MYGKLIKGVIEYAPKDYIMGDGRIIPDFDTNEEELKRFGYKIVEDTKPDYNKDTQYIIIGSLEELDEKIIIHYHIKENDIEPTEAEKLEGKIDSLEEQQLMLEQAMQDLILMTMEGGGM